MKIGLVVPMIKVIEIASQKAFWVVEADFRPSLDFLRIDNSEYPNWRSK